MARGALVFGGQALRLGGKGKGVERQGHIVPLGRRRLDAQPGRAGEAAEWRGQALEREAIFVYSGPEQRGGLLGDSPRSQDLLGVIDRPPDEQRPKSPATSV